jgi:hypothetical protein
MFRWSDTYLITCFFSLAAAVLTYKRTQPFYMKIFLLFLAVTFAIESTMWVIAVYLHNRTTWLANIGLIIEFSFYGLFFYQVLRGVFIKNLIRVFLVTFPLFSIYNITLGQGLHVFNHHTFIFGGVMVVMLCVMYFYELMRSPSYVDIIREPVFWIATGVIFFYIGTLPYFGLINYLFKHFPEIAKSYFVIVKVLNILLYILFTIAYLCRRGRQRL